MTFTVKEVIEKLKDKKELTVSLIQREMPTGFIQAGKLYKELQDKQYIKKNNNDKYTFNKERIEDEMGIVFKPSLKIIFLDIDGVLNCSTTKDKCLFYTGVEDKKIGYLKQIVDATKAKIVLVSTWRYTWYKEPNLKSQQDELATYLDDRLAKQDLSIFDKIDDEAINRGEGILDYISKLKQQDIDVDDFAILDDEFSDYMSARLLRYLVQTSYKAGGLKQKHISKAIDILYRN
jgi:hypothetical protein